MREWVNERIKIPFPKSSHTEHTVYIPSVKNIFCSILVFLKRTQNFFFPFLYFFPFCVCVWEVVVEWCIFYTYLRRYAIYATRKNSSYRIGQTIYSSIILLRFFHGIYLLICIFGILAILSLCCTYFVGSHLRRILKISWL